jgi:DNA-binding Lrp family transcriptional regulator
MRIMAKISKEQQNEDEMKILAELQKNAKENIDTIAKHCGFSKHKAWRMIKQLEKNKKIWGYSAIVDNEKQGLQKYILFLKRSNKPFEKKDFSDIAMTRLKHMYEDLGITMLNTYMIHGEYDCVVIFTAKDINHAKKFCDLLMQKYSGPTEKMHLSQILFTLREQNILNPDPMEIRGFL